MKTNVLELLKETEMSKKSREQSEIIYKQLDIDSSYLMGRWFEGIQLGKFNISVQASGGHYCNPRKTLFDLSQYESMELAVYKADNSNFFRDVDFFEGFNRIDELKERFEGTVFGAVPIDLINDFIDYLKTL